MKGKFKYKSKTIRYKLKVKSYQSIKVVAITRIGKNIFAKEIEVLEFDMLYDPRKDYEIEKQFYYIDILTDDELREKTEKRIKWKIDFEIEQNEIENNKKKLFKRISKRIEG